MNVDVFLIRHLQHCSIPVMWWTIYVIQTFCPNPPWKSWPLYFTHLSLPYISPYSTKHNQFLSFLCFRHLATRYVNIHGHTDDNAFWPGHLLDKLELCMPDRVPLQSSILHCTRQQKRVNMGMNNDLRIWPVHELGYVQYGSIA